MRRELKGLLALGSMLAAACSDGPKPTEPSLAPDAAEARVQQQGESEVGPNDYIVVLRGNESSVSAASARLARATGLKVKTMWSDAIQGFLAEVPPGAVAALRRDPAVAYATRDHMAYMDNSGPEDPSVLVNQGVAGIWGLDRIQERTLPLDGIYSYTSTGAGIHVYIIDSGILATHSQFGGRVLPGISFVPGVPSTSDCNGHGTHVAGTIGGITYGVAKNVWLHSVRVFNCTGGAPFSRIISAVNWVAANDVAPAVTNMSLGGGFDAATNAAVNNLAAFSNNVVVVAAGNSNANACASSPSSAVNAMTVGSTGEGVAIPPALIDTRSSFSNFGGCLDLFAPGRNIRSAWWTSNVATAVLSGTSMSSPHVAGVVARRRQTAPAANWLAIRNNIVAGATLGLVLNPGVGSPNRLLYSSFFP